MIANSSCISLKTIFFIIYFLLINYSIFPEKYIARIGSVDENNFTAEIKYGKPPQQKHDIIILSCKEYSQSNICKRYEKSEGRITQTELFKMKGNTTTKVSTGDLIIYKVRLHDFHIKTNAENSKITINYIIPINEGVEVESKVYEGNKELQLIIPNEARISVAIKDEDENYFSEDIEIDSLEEEYVREIKLEKRKIKYTVRSYGSYNPNTYIKSREFRGASIWKNGQLQNQKTPGTFQYTKTKKGEEIKDRITLKKEPNRYKASSEYYSKVSDGKFECNIYMECKRNSWFLFPGGQYFLDNRYFIGTLFTIGTFVPWIEGFRNYKLNQMHNNNYGNIDKGLYLSTFLILVMLKK